MRKILLSFAGAAALLAAEASWASPLGRTIAEQGSRGGAAPCASCHGANYQGEPAIKAPPLAGLPSAYIVARLDHYASPEGHNALMKQVAAALSPPERAAVAAYLSSLKPAAKPVAEAGKARP